MLGTLLIVVSLAGGAGQAEASAPAAVAAQTRSDFSGSWTYNPDESVNAATNKPETARAATDLRRFTRGPREASGAPRGGGGGFSGGGRGPGGGAGGSQDGLYALFIEQRGARRDLLEIAPSLNVSVTPE